MVVQLVERQAVVQRVGRSNPHEDSVFLFGGWGGGTSLGAEVGRPPLRSPLPLAPPYPLSHPPLER
jgi:hypothetical protein